eukprot:1572305-Amphidinium_carterae.1
MAIQTMKGGPRWQIRKEEFRKKDGTIMSDEEIKAYWQLKKLVSRNRGKSLHKSIERHWNGGVPHEACSREFQQFLAFERDVLRRLEVLYSEAVVFHYGLLACGIVDLLCRDTAGRLVLLDWKIVPKMSLTNPFRRMKSPLEHLDDCNFNRYALQLNLYRYILESEYGEEVSRMRLVQLHPQLQSYVTREISRMDAEVDAIVAHLEHFRNATHQPGSVFEFDRILAFVAAEQIVPRHRVFGPTHTYVRSGSHVE